ncbi:protein FAR1-RELATED SEQUENCE 2-like [Hibiscus syriacus]|uniref:Protein FAR1-RELATED SEQUENCE 2-like n=1 Tax=Hibiscus syriacus TaxID=106335 RepID=A0A6A2X1B5_HIBSY|nr:pentatricopeptide repeat-containing protein At1g71210, mitochondrial-like [Hibiscus syriacus]XP_039039753.1 pentatricopeptide repeat-containing protein At1g71210, mitochondrial-like [Hibiscus syriacus]KAE8668462.1 protein FAR1-RELATED SEQUENCE 2-like [Hibiscus syriacus]
MLKLLGSIKHVSKSPVLKNRNGNSYSHSSLFISSSCSSDSSSVRCLNLSAKDVVASLRDWFKPPTPNTAFLDRIFSILSSQEQAARDDASSRHAADLALSHLNIHLCEEFVLQVLSYGRRSSKGVLSCLKFFDWAGRQPGFQHTRATYHAIFKILSKAKLMPLMLEFLQDFMKHRCSHTIRFYEILVMGYALAGKPGMALQLFGRMRFQGTDLGTFAYHVLLNALVDESCFDAADMVAKQIFMMGFENDITYSILVKCLCKQQKLDEAVAYLRSLAERRKFVSGHAVSIVVNALCKGNRFKHAATLLQEFTELNVPLEHAYGIWLHNVVQQGRLNWSLDFVNSTKLLDKDVPPLFQCNVLVLRLLREYRMNEVYDLLIEMHKDGISPDKVTMNAVLCFFCKAGMVDFAIELYNSRSEFGLSLSRMTYCHLINDLCSIGVIDEAYCVLRNSIREGYFPSKRIFVILVDALCKDGKLDKIKELVVLILERKFRPSHAKCDLFIVALCKINRVEDAYLLHGELSRLNKDFSPETYFHLIHGFCKSNRGDIAAALLLEMQEKAHKPNRKLFRFVFCCLCGMQSPENQFFKLLEMQLSQFEPSSQIFNYFIVGAGYAKKPELAKEVFEMMQRSGITPSLRSDILMLLSYLMNDRISDGLNFFNDVRQRSRAGRKLYSSMVVGLCKADRIDYALNFMREMRNNNVLPSMECYELLIQSLCRKESYGLAVSLVNELEKTRGYITSFIGNVLLHSLKTEKLYEAWVQFRELQDETADILFLGQLIGIFSGCIKANQDIETLEEIIAKCFPTDVYTYNTLLRKLSASKVDHAFELYNWICEKGYKPNRWTYDIIIHGLLRKGRRAEAQRWLEEMFEKGFDLTERTKLLI